MVGCGRKKAMVHAELRASGERLSLRDEGLLDGAVGVENDLIASMN